MALIIPCRLTAGRCHGLNLSWKHDKTQGRCNSFCPGQMHTDEWKQQLAHALLLQMGTEGICTEVHLSFYRGRDETCRGDEMGHPGMWQMPHWGTRIFCSSFSLRFLSLTAVHSCACTCPSELIPPLCPFAVICISHGSKASALLRYLASFPNYTLPSAISFLQFHSKKKNPSAA